MHLYQIADEIMLIEWKRHREFGFEFAFNTLSFRDAKREVDLLGLRFVV